MGNFRVACSSQVETGKLEENVDRFGESRFSLLFQGLNAEKWNVIQWLCHLRKISAEKGL